MRSLLLLVFVAGALAVPFSQKGEAEESPLWVRSGKFQGDMLFTEEQMRGSRVSVKDKRYRWPNATLYYQLSNDFNEDEKRTIRESLEFYNQRTCVTVRERTNQNDYVSVTKEDTGCWSYVGYNQWVGQPLNLQNNNYGTCLLSGIVQHEFLHALGVQHEQCDPKRDDWVEILWQNMDSAMAYNFDRYTDAEVTAYGCDYDLTSVMHYDRYSFSTNGQPTIRARSDPNMVLGNTVSLTDLDIKKLNCMYVGLNPACRCECPNPE